MIAHATMRGEVQLFMVDLVLFLIRLRSLQIHGRPEGLSRCCLQLLRREGRAATGSVPAVSMNLTKEMTMPKKARRSDYAARLAARRMDGVNAYCLAVGGPKGEDPRIRRIAKDAGVQERTMRGYLTGKQDMGRKGCEARTPSFSLPGIPSPSSPRTRIRRSRVCGSLRTPNAKSRSCPSRSARSGLVR